MDAFQISVILTAVTQIIVLLAIAFPRQFVRVATAIPSAALPTLVNPTGAHHWETYATLSIAIRAKTQSLVMTTPHSATMRNL